MTKQMQTPKIAKNVSSWAKAYDTQVEWTWDKSSSNDYINLVNDDRDVEFNRHYSDGTAVVRGSKPFSTDQYFWEILMASPVYGTDMMIGIGTPDADVSLGHDKFISFLGMDDHSWGLSYSGLFHHNGESQFYSNRFGQGCVIGVHLDMWKGTLSYYMNKKYLGIAARGLKGKTLYAMASSTAACSVMRIVSSCSFRTSLQFLCCARIRELIPDDKYVLKELLLPPGLQRFLESNLSWLLDQRHAETCLLVSPGQNTARAFSIGKFATAFEAFCPSSDKGSIVLHERNLFGISEVNMQSHHNGVSDHEDSTDNFRDSNTKPETSLQGAEDTSIKPDNVDEASISNEDNRNSNR